MHTVLAEFCQRVEGIPFHGMGLSADAYQPDFFELMARLEERRCPPDFVELFRASTPMLEAIRKRFPRLPLPYHAEGLWLTQAGWLRATTLPGDLTLALEQMRALESAWLNHECASKLVGGYPFGTYLPPLFTGACAEIVARHARRVQDLLDDLARKSSDRAREYGPLLLLELPPLTYFGFGDLSVGRYFRHLAERTTCGLVLDIGHLWTHYRYRRRAPGESLDRFVGAFLDEFPLERVVEIHVAGLAVHPTDASPDPREGPLWLDAHGAPIPAVLFDVLERVLGDARLTALRGVALEVDTKPIDLIADEFGAFRRRFGPMIDRWSAVRPSASGVPCESASAPDQIGAEIVQGYERMERAYADAVLGRPAESENDAYGKDRTLFLDRYRERYLPYEVLHWGGDLPEMFPYTCAELAAEGIALEDFVAFWFKGPQSIPEPFDFFLLKVERFVEFVRQRAPRALSVARQEAARLRADYACANAPALSGGGGA